MPSTRPVQYCRYCLAILPRLALRAPGLLTLPTRERRPVAEAPRSRTATSAYRAHTHRRITARDKLMVVDSASGANMPDEMGAFRTTIEIENPARRGERRTLESVLVDTGAELSWVPAPILESLGECSLANHVRATPPLGNQQRAPVHATPVHGKQGPPYGGFAVTTGGGLVTKRDRKEFALPSSHFA